MGDSAVSQRTRSKNWSADEVLALTTAAVPFTPILEGSKKVSAATKETVWLKITEEVNVAGGAARTVAETKVKYKNVRSSAKQKGAHNIVERGKTGGGPSNVQTLSAAEDVMLSTIKETGLRGVSGGIDISELHARKKPQVAASSRAAETAGSLVRSNENPSDLTGSLNGTLAVTGSEAVVNLLGVESGARTGKPEAFRKELDVNLIGSGHAETRLTKRIESGGNDLGNSGGEGGCSKENVSSTNENKSTPLGEPKKKRVRVSEKSHTEVLLERQVSLL